MSIEKRLQELARLIGLTSYDIKTYIALVENGPLTARDVAIKASIPSSKVYSVLHKLYRLGYVEIDDKRRPELFYAVSPLDVFSRIMQRFTDYVNSTKPLIDSLQLIYESVYKGKVTAQSELLYVVRGLDSTKELIMKSMGYGSLDIATPYIELLDHRILSMVEEVSRNNEVRLLVSQEIIDYIKDLPPRIHIRIRDKLFGGGFVGIGGVVLVIKHGMDYISLYSRQDYITDIAKTYFNYLWNSSEVLQR
ncbi:transcriptional regulator, TrmB [Vulcanisaeta moutnovskia 768-28]|uniref:Transcriptional regulator, TrmB n=1 Tax=Vulcanisaeta moutnovskia (strain 768-28) TaxID=985053 RepID=F0QU68_VULM7|nr:helix-turn-helix domain-containing protein [Vulcanisaeta moutnovskia]ADY00608.1 transcriptional regulator, TrmB [Vulcanisaeta moutnovskia 768-28]